MFYFPHLCGTWRVRRNPVKKCGIARVDKSGIGETINARYPVTINARYASHFALEVRSRAIKPIVIANLANSVARTRKKSFHHTKLHVR
jgi:hypothetical protein